MKKVIITIIVAALFIIMAVTNPSLYDHRETVRQILKTQADKIAEKKTEGITDKVVSGVIGTDISTGKVGKTIDGVVREVAGAVLGNVADVGVDEEIGRENYVFFSLTTLKWNGNKRRVGIGIFGNVFLFADIDEYVDKHI